MSNRRHESDFIPEDLTSTILERLPVTSLLRFKSVCKSWYSIIKSPIFIANYNLRYASSIEDNNHVIIKHCLKTSNRAHVSFLPDKNKKDGAAAEEDPLPRLLRDVSAVPVPFFEDADEQLGIGITPKFRGSCNGLICVAGYIDCDSDLFARQCDLISLWNPSNREIKRLPPSPFDPRGDGMEWSHLEGMDVGLGYDSTTNDFKVVRILHFYPGVRFERPVEVYNLSTDSWRRIDVVPTDCMRWGSLSSVYLDGFYYWWEERFPEDYETIACFDFAREVLSEVTPPPDLLEGCCANIIKYKDSLAVITTDYDRQQRPPLMSTVLWVLKKDDNGENTWAKLFKFRQPYHDIVGMFRNGNPLINVDHMRYKLALYDIESRKVVASKVFGPSYCKELLQVVSYVANLRSFQ